MQILINALMIALQVPVISLTLAVWKYYMLSFMDTYDASKSLLKPLADKSQENIRILIQVTSFSTFLVPKQIGKRSFHRIGVSTLNCNSGRQTCVTDHYKEILIII